ncbi:hypothetical protein TWF506_007717 [Arthrobotrys conoides]|uniref:Uncharacterized protein n=1 Tax=Arthrobotrys conoides TaxID=74498 RepID=A0AAN8NRS7_9PEZI
MTGYAREDEVASAADLESGSPPYSSTTTSTSLRNKSKKYTSAIARWIKGPVPPETLKIKPIFPDIQAIPIRILDNLCPKKRTKIIAWLLACAIWITAFVLVVHYSYFTGEEMMLGCSTNLWWVLCPTINTEKGI